jgi:hypothetical protein
MAEAERDTTPAMLLHLSRTLTAART